MNLHSTLAFVVAGVLVAASCGREPATPEPTASLEPQSARESAAKPVASAQPVVPAWCGAVALENPLVVVGVDGATWAVVDRMLAAGELPRFRALMERGVRARIVDLHPLSSPVVWTTYATGVYPREHDILDFAFPYVGGQKSPVLSTVRRSPAVWSVASACGRHVGVVGYFVSHPAEVVNGFMLSDSLLGGHTGSTYPPELADDIVLIDSSAGRQAAYRRFFPWGYDPRNRLDEEHPHYEAANIIFGRIDGAILRDANVQRAVFQHLPQRWDLLMTYFRVVDHASHSTWIYYDDSEFDEPAAAAEKALLEGVIPESYRYVDDFLGRLLSRLTPETNVVVLSDHGFGSATGPYAIDHPTLKERLTGNHRPDGLLLAAGPDFRTGRVEPVNMMDVTPLLLALLRLPLSEELAGRIPEALLSERFLRERRPASVPAYDFDWDFVTSTARTDLASQKEAMAELEALGYIEPGTEVGEGEGGPEADFWAIDRGVRRMILRGEAASLLMRERWDEVAALMTLIAERDPELAQTFALEVEIDAKLAQAEFASPIFGPDVLERFLATWAPAKP